MKSMVKGSIIMKTIIITGANSGLGFECAKNILLENPGYFIVMACRSIEKAEKSKSELIKMTKNENIAVMELNLSSLNSVRKFAENFKQAGYPPLFGIVCNAGISNSNVGVTEDGFDIVFGTNHLGHFLLTVLLLPLIEENGRITVVSSDMHNPPNGLTYRGAEELAHPASKINDIYSQSKLCNLYFTYELAGRLSEMGRKITVNAFNPGLLTDTNFHVNSTRSFSEDFMKKVADRIGYLSESGKALADMVTKPYYGENTGKYNDRGEDIPSSELSYNAENAKKLWESSVNYTKLQKDETLDGLL